MADNSPAEDISEQDERMRENGIDLELDNVARLLFLCVSLRPLRVCGEVSIFIKELIYDQTT